MVFPFNNPPQFNVCKQGNNNYHKFNFVQQWARSREEEKKVQSSSLPNTFDDDCWLYQNPPEITVPLSTPPHMMSVILF